MVLIIINKIIYHSYIFVNETQDLCFTKIFIKNLFILLKTIEDEKYEKVF